MESQHTHATLENPTRLNPSKAYAHESWTFMAISTRPVDRTNFDRYSNGTCSDQEHFVPLFNQISHVGFDSDLFEAFTKRNYAMLQNLTRLKARCRSLSRNFNISRLEKLIQITKLYIYIYIYKIRED